MKVSMGKVPELIEEILRAGEVPMLHGSPAIGKSAVNRMIAEKFNLKMIDVRLSTCDPTELNGFPNLAGKKASYLPFDTFPVEGDSLPAGYSGWYLFLDEITSAPPATQVASYKLLLDRMVGQLPLHKNVAIATAGNLATDGAVVTEMSTALQSRLVHLEGYVDAAEWCEFATSHHFDHRITSFINFKPGKVYDFSPDHTDKTYPSPRTWEKTNKFAHLFDDKKKGLPIISGSIGEGCAREFMTFCEIYGELPKLTDIIAMPKSVYVPNEPSILWALSGSLAQNMKPENLEALLTYASRLPVEFQVTMQRDAYRRNPKIGTVPAFQKWLAVFARERMM